MFFKKDLRWGQVWFFITLILLFTPGDDLPEITWVQEYHFDKVIHAFTFALLAFLFIFPRRKDELEMKNMWVTIVVLACFVYAILSEIIQHIFIPYRTGDILDVLADWVGAGSVFLWFRFHNYEDVLWYVDGDTIKMKPEFTKKRKPL